MKDIRKISTDELSLFLSEAGEKRFRIKQIEEWLWQKGVHSFDEMKNLSLSLREKLKSQFSLEHAIISQKVQSNDKSIKFLFTLHDKHTIEGVLIPAGKRVTACISVQVGCPLKCRFCATGQGEYQRNLHYSEIFDQIILMNREAQLNYDKEISHVVFMGMGEPLLNYENVKKAIEIFTSQTGLNRSPSRITLSTAGIVDKIGQVADEFPKIGLAISLHSADKLKREFLMPITKTNSLENLREALRDYYEKTKQRISIEYLLLSGINDSEQDANKLLQFCKAFPVKINLIPYNSTDLHFQRASEKSIQDFKSYLESKNLVVTIRQSRGQDIAAACGQLAGRLRNSIKS
ncbi:MAG TPA: 23S rRNA (adenine(2503)-C(2))-methyltransferase RlmN [Bacteroidales bacterium]|jgi:23S rRNA (adenine2503-C2)-methyltransferase|nr:23S rRNA (adenine(2503)-C(2))-methyltransferase RlmN [Bacteroidales bacterium]HQA87284.1 23S rRNA (adenine(2503)-C(2))-methyltransferase RlmN [Bacteroidales bacterium]